MSDTEEEVAISSSRIGTKAYWDDCYDHEMRNYHHFGDCGEIWFGVRNSQRIVDWIADHCVRERRHLCRVLDIGCGNGYVLLELAKRDFKNLLGVDYSANSVHFCRQIAAKESPPEEGLTIRFEELDVLSDTIDADLKSRAMDTTYDYVIDKGTYDAICLQPDVDLDAIREKYRRFVLAVMSTTSAFILMSCNFTRNELFRHLRVDELFALVDEIPTPTITFGGRVGAQVTAIILKKL